MLTLNPNPITSTHPILTFNISPEPLLVLSTQENPPKTLFEISQDGRVTWPNGIAIGEAAKALDATFKFKLQSNNGITSQMKEEMRDSIFAEIIEMTVEKGPLSIEDLQLAQESYKIMDILKNEHI